VLIILEKLNIDEIHHLLIEKLKHFESIEDIEFKHLPSSKLIQILINQLTLSCLKKKFNNLEYYQENGYIQELDFSKVDNKILDWRYREIIQDHTEIHGIKHLKYLVKIIPFSLNWAIRNDFTMQCQVELLKTLGQSNEISIKKSLISQLINIRDYRYRKSIDKLIENKDSLSNLSPMTLAKILLNYIVIQFLNRKAPNLRFKLKEGMVSALSIEDVKLIKIPKFIELLTSLNSLRLNNCCIYEIPIFINNLKRLKNLDLAHNKIRIIPDSIAKLNLLKKINLKNNPIIKKL
jgi:Leucine-rich repeat (LRR) protein